MSLMLLELAAERVNTLKTISHFVRAFMYIFISTGAKLKIKIKIKYVLSFSRHSKCTRHSLSCLCCIHPLKETFRSLGVKLLLVANRQSSKCGRLKSEEVSRSRDENHLFLYITRVPEASAGSPTTWARVFPRVSFQFRNERDAASDQRVRPVSARSPRV